MHSFLHKTWFVLLNRFCDKRCFNRASSSLFFSFKFVLKIFWQIVLIIFFYVYGSLSYAANEIPLTLEEAILLSVRDNPNVQSSRLSYVSDKFNYYVQQWQFKPHYSLQASVGFNRARASGNPYINSQNNNLQPAVSWLSPIGTQVSLAATNNRNGHYNPGLSFQVSQPLLRGFGRAIVETALNNACDSLYIARLNIEGVLRTTVTNVVNAYLDIVTAQKTITIDEDALKRAELSVVQTKLFIKAGRKAGNELITVQANVAGAKTQLENDKNNLRQTRYALLTAMGIDPNSPIEFSPLNIPKLIAKYHLPSLDSVKKLILENDIQYQTDQRTLYGSTTRSLLTAEDNTRWQLNFNVNAITGNGAGGGFNSGFNSLVNGQNLSQSVGLTLQIPIDDQIAKQSVANAKIALQRAKLALLQEKWSKETSAINGWNLVISAKRALRYAEDAEKLQEKTYHISNQKYLHGLIDSLEWQSAQVQLIQSQQTLLNAQISYLKALVNLDLLIGNTLRTWQVRVRV